MAQRHESESARKRRYPFDSEQSLANEKLFSTYEKIQGLGQLLGSEYQHLMCAMFALKLCADDRVIDFRLTTNNSNYKVFDDIVIDVKFKKDPSKTFLFQMKHGEPQKKLSVADFIKGNLKNKNYLKNQYCLTNHIDALKQINKNHLVCILYTNNTTSLTNDLELNLDTHKVIVEFSPGCKYADLLVNTEEVKTSDILQFHVVSNKSSEKFSTPFYLFSNQNNVFSLRVSMEREFNKLLRSDVFGSFVDHFMKNWWYGNFVLTKTDVLMKLTELALSPFIKTLSAEMTNPKVSELSKYIMTVDVTVLETSKDNIVTKIWPEADKWQEITKLSRSELLEYSLTSGEELAKIRLAAAKYGLTQYTSSGEEVFTPFSQTHAIIKSLSKMQISKILWYLDKVPLVVLVSDENKDLVESVLEMWKHHSTKRKLVLLHSLSEMAIEKKRADYNVFCNLSDLLKSTTKELYAYVKNNFYVSLQGKQEISLAELLKTYPDFDQVIGVRELLEMSRETLTIGHIEEVSFDSYIPRNISSVFVDLNKLLEVYMNSVDALIVMNCEKNVEFGSTVLFAVELVEYLKNRFYDKIDKLVVLSTDKKCTVRDFEEVCQISKKSVYVFQVSSPESCVLLLRKGSGLDLEEIKQKTQFIKDTEVAKIFDNPLNAICGPVGMGKSTLLKFLSKNFKNGWSIYVNLREQEDFFNTNPTKEEMFCHFLGLDTIESLVNKFRNCLVSDSCSVDSFFKFRGLLMKTKKIYMFLDELDQVGESHLKIIFDFVREISSEGAFVWLSARDHMETKIIEAFNVVPLQINELTEEERRNFFSNKLADKYSSDDIKKIVEVVFSGLGQFLSTPLHLKILSEVFEEHFAILKAEKGLRLHRLYEWLFYGLLKRCPNTRTDLKRIEVCRLEEYQILALWFCFGEKIFSELPLDPRMKKTVDQMKNQTDDLGLTVPKNDSVFFHNQFGEYFASLWLSAHPKTLQGLETEYFSESRESLRLMLDTNFAEENSFLLNIIYRNFNDLNDDFNSVDTVGRTALHLACSYGNKYPTSLDYHKYLNRESTLYTKLIEKLLETGDIFLCDDLFNLSCVAYASRSRCLYPLEKILDKSESVDLDDLFVTYDSETIAYYASRLGYHNLLNVVMKENDDLLKKEFGGFSLIQHAILGSKGENEIEGNKKIVKVLLKRIDCDIRKGLISDLINFAVEHQCYHMVNILKQMVTLDSLEYDIFDQETPRSSKHHWSYMLNLVEVPEEAVEIPEKETDTNRTLQELSELKLVEDMLKDVIFSSERSPSEKMKTIITWKQRTESIFKRDILSQDVDVLHENSSQKFKKRIGTTDRGRDYELLVMAHAMLKLVTDDSISDFTLSASDEEYGQFDDVVITTKSEMGDTTYALQLKYFGSGRYLFKNHLTQTRGSLNLQKYFESFQQMPKISNCRFILFTNSKFSREDDAEIRFEDEEISMKMHQCKPIPFLNTSKDGTCYRFEVVGGCLTKLERYRSFFDNFFLYTNQYDIDRMKTKTAEEFQFGFNTSYPVFEKYFDFISKWNKREGRKEKLHKSWMRHLIAINLLSPFVREISSGNVNDKMKLFREAISNFCITILEEEAETVKYLWGDIKIGPELLPLLNTVASKYLLTYSWISSIEEVDRVLLTKLLWLMGKCPLMVTRDPRVYKAIDLCPDKKFILIGKSPTVGHLRHSVFRKLLDLKSFRIYERILKEFKFPIQGKQEVSLETLLEYDERFGLSLTTNDLVEMLQESYSIGDPKEELPNPYMKRQISRNIISCDYLKAANHKDTMIIITDKKKNIDFKNFTSGVEKNMHCFTGLEDGNLEWICSKGDVTELHRYQINNYFVKESEIQSDGVQNIVLITGPPGNGKSLLLKSLKNTITSLAILLRPGEMSSLCDTLKERGENEILEAAREEILNIKFASAKSIEKKVLRHLVMTNQVVFLWDALDELLNDNRRVIINLITKLSSSSISQYVTSRDSLKSKLETKFCVLSRTISLLTAEEQRAYIENRLRGLYNEEKIQEILIKIKSVLELLKSDDILGIPLQLFMFAETVRGGVYNEILITDLYNYFVKEKFNVYLVKTDVDLSNPFVRDIVENHKKTMLWNYEKIALKSLFSEESLTKMKLDCSDADQLEADQFGFLTKGTMKFKHLSYAEYFTACYFEKKFRNIPDLRILFEEEYTNVRFFFDMLLAKHSPAHVAVLYKNFDSLKKCQSELKTKDGAGRSLLHIASSWGSRYPVLTIKKEKDIYVVDDENSFQVRKEDDGYITMLEYLIENCDSSDIDGLFKMTPLFYAEMTNSLFAKIKLLKKKQTNFSEVDGNLCNLLYYSVLLGYDEILDLCTSVPFITTTKNGDSLLHLSVKHLKCFVKILKLSEDLSGVNYRNKNGETPLHLAVQSRNIEIVRLLVENGADVNCCTNCGETPLYLACKNGARDVVRLLLEKGTSRNVKFENTTPLHVASQKEYDEIVELLIKKL